MTTTELDRERKARLEAQSQVVELQERIKLAGVEQRRAVAKEREECAKLCDSWTTFCITNPPANAVAEGLAIAIRSRTLEAPPSEPLEDPCPGCMRGGVCRTIACGRLKLPVDHPYRKARNENR